MLAVIGQRDHDCFTVVDSHMEKKDYFSRQSQAYAAFRPKYPEELYAFIFRHLKDRSCAWDCGTGNGQVARYLADRFHTVYATDISQQQLDHAFAGKNIFYSVAAAEHTPFGDNQFDLITVAQALHWFDLHSFYREANRTAKPGGLLAVWGYGLLTVDPVIDDLFLDFYNRQTGPYWDPARRLVENHYRDLPFPFEALPCPDFSLSVQWTADQFGGYLQSWSATQKYIAQHGTNPVIPFMQALLKVWGSDEIKPVTFPLFMKLGIIRK